MEDRYCLLLDGTFNQNSGVFHDAPALRDEDVKHIVETTAHRVIRLLERRGVLGDTFEYDAFAEEYPMLAGMTFASTKMQVAGGARAGRPVRRVLQDPAEGIKPEEDELTKNFENAQVHHNSD